MVTITSIQTLNSTVRAGLVLILLFQAMVIFPVRVNQSQPIESASRGVELDETMDQRMRGVHLVEAGRQGRVWELWAEEAVAFKDRPKWEVRQTRVVFFAKSGVEFQVTGQVGEIDTLTKDIEVRGNVVTTSSNGYRFRTVQMRYNATARTLVSDSDVDMDGPGEKGPTDWRVQGVGMTADLNSDQMTIHRDVRARRDLGKSRMATLTSRTAEFSSTHRSARFFDDVVMNVDQMRVVGGAALFDYDPESQMIKNIDITGGARVSDLEKWATAKNLKINLEKDRFVLKGAPRVVQGQDELRGDEIIIEDQGRRVRVEKARARIEERDPGVSP